MVPVSCEAVGAELLEGGAARAFFGGEEAVEAEGAGLVGCAGEAAGGEGRDDGVGSGDGIDGDAGVDGGRGNEPAGVGDAGRACVADDGDPGAGFEVGDQFGGAAGLVVHVVAEGRCGDAEVVQQLLGLACVLAGDAIDGAEDTKGAEGDVFEIADRGCDEVEAGRQRFCAAAAGMVLDLIRRALLFSLPSIRHAHPSGEYKRLRLRRRVLLRLFLPGFEQVVDHGEQLGRAVLRVKKLTEDTGG